MAKIDLNEQANKILQAAQKSGVEQNFLFVTTFKRYQVQLKILNDLEHELSGVGLLITKEYVKGRQNVCASPVVTQYNKTADSANRTAATLMKIVTSLKDVTMDEPEYDENDIDL